MKAQRIELKIKGVAIDRETETPIIILKDQHKERVLPLCVGPFEASAIIVEMEGIHPPRPLTHDLLAQFFQIHGFTMKNLEIYASFEDSYLSRINYRKGIRHFSMEVRPSDGIALAARLGAPIYATPDVISSQNPDTYLLGRTGSPDWEVLFLGNEKWETPVI